MEHLVPRCGLRVAQPERRADEHPLAVAERQPELALVVVLRPAAVGWYFLWQSLKGGIDVSRRVCSPTLPVAPEVIRYRCAIEDAMGRVLFVWMVGLMPGTAPVGWDDSETLAVHVIDRRVYDRDGLGQLERRLRAVLAP